MTSTTKYIAIDSSFRDRNRFPNPGEFEINLSQSGSKDRFSAYDPVCNSAPLIIFTTAFNTTTGSTTVAGTVKTTPVGAPVINVGNTSSPYTLIISTPVATDGLNTTKNYYVGAVLYGAALVPAHNRIVAYEYLAQETIAAVVYDVGMFTFDVPITTFADTNAVSIVNPSDITDPTHPLLFVPTSPNIDNYYVSRILYNITRSNYVEISGFSNKTHILSGESIAGLGWTLSDRFAISVEPPSVTGVFTAGSTTSVVRILESVLPLTYPLVGSYLLITSIAAASTALYEKIISVDSTTVPGTLLLTITPGLATAPNAGDTFEFLAFSRDNYNPLVYSGSTVSQQDMVCYNIQLIDLILPNTVLDASRGGIAAFYPFVYVEFSNVSSPTAGTTNVLYSNSPFARNVLFKVAISDINNPLITPFVRITGSATVQTVKFKPNDNLRFVVRLPGGEVFSTEDKDTFSPQSPNPLLQVSALFGITRNTPDSCPSSLGMNNLRIAYAP